MHWSDSKQKDIITPLQWKIDEIFKDWPNLFGIANDILVLGHDSDGRNHDNTSQKLLQICKQGNLKPNKEKFCFRCTAVSFLERWYPSMEWDLTHKRWKHLQRCSIPKKELQAFLGIINFLSKFSPSTANICKSLRKLTSARTEWTWNASYQKIFEEGKINHKRRCMYEILWWNKAILDRDWCIWNWTGSCPTTSKKQYKSLQRWSTRQQHNQTHCIC